MFPGTFIPIIIILIVATIGYAIFADRQRRKAIKAMATQLGLAFCKKDNSVWQLHDGSLPLFNAGHSRKAANVLTGQIEDIGVSIFDFRYTTGHGKHSSTHRQTVVLMQLSGKLLPSMEIRPEGFFSKIATSFGYQDFDFGEHYEFSGKYLVRGKDEEAIRRIMTHQLMEFMASKPKRPTIQTSGESFLFFRPRGRVKPAKLDKLLGEAFEACTAVA